MNEIEALLKRYKIRSLLDLALLIPQSYEDTTPKVHPEIGQINTLEVLVESSQVYKGRLKVSFRLVRSNRILYSTFFRTTPYHHKLFAIGTHHYIKGKVEEYRGYLQMNQPRSIKQIGAIVPSYGKRYNSQEISRLIKLYINPKSLYDQGLLMAEVELLMGLHFPTNLSLYFDNGRLKPSYLKMLKGIEALNYLKKLTLKKDSKPPVETSVGNIEDFIQSLPFVLSDDQKRAIEAIRGDLMNKARASRRLVVGDVGSGKTMVILAAAAMVRDQGAIVMAPTSILADQLYAEAKKFLQPLGIDVGIRRQGKIENATECQLLIGTHALLFSDELIEASLVMIDEQHRFGTAQREALEALLSKGDRGVHMVQFSATPIPRTQAMMLSKMVDVTLIEQMPYPKDITTKIASKADFPALLEHIKSEITKGHQALIIYPWVEESNEGGYKSLKESEPFWAQHFKKLYLTYGKDKDKEQKLQQFRDDGELLLATTVVEVGISLPRLTTIVIVGAELMGLATLHQLRGRVGRNGLKSWCYLFTHNPKNERLRRFCSVDNGFEIAQLDLEFRQSGDLVEGSVQSGQQFRWLNLLEDEEIIQKSMARLGY